MTEVSKGKAPEGAPPNPWKIADVRSAVDALAVANANVMLIVSTLSYAWRVGDDVVAMCVTMESDRVFSNDGLPDFKQSMSFRSGRVDDESMIDLLEVATCWFATQAAAYNAAFEPDGDDD